MKTKWKNIAGWFTENEGEFAQIFCADKVVLEIGCLFGRSTCCIADVAKQVHTVDNFTHDLGGVDQHLGPQGLKWFLANIKDRENIEYFIGHSKDVIPTLQDSFYDVVLVDGLHIPPYVEEDVLNSFPKLKENGIFLMHDYYDDPAKWGEVKIVTDKLFNMKYHKRMESLVAVNKNQFKG